MTSVECFGNNTQVTVSLDDLNEERFTFTYMESKHRFQYTKYEFLQRKTRRHKFLVMSCWSWYKSRGNDVPAVPSQEIMDVVRESFVSRLTFRLETDK